MGPFGVGPTKQGHTKDGFEAITSVASSTNQSTSEPQEGISLLTADSMDRVLIDFGATDCIIPFADAVSHFVPGKIHIKLAAQGTTTVAKGHGVLTLRFHGKTNSINVKISDVIVDPSARATYLSTGALQEAGITTTFPGLFTQCILIDVNTEEEICRGRRYGR